MSALALVGAMRWCRLAAASAMEHGRLQRRPRGSVSNTFKPAARDHAAAGA